MAFIPVPECWQVVMRFTATGLRPKTMGFHVRDEIADMSASRAGFIAAEVGAWAAADLAPTYGTGLTMSNVQVRDLSTNTGVVVDYGTTVAGTHAGNGMPGNVAFCISFRTGYAGKSNRGRVYHPWLSEADVTGNSLSSTQANEIVDAWVSLKGIMNTIDCTMVVVSKYTNGAPRVTGTYRTITDFIYVDLNVDTQRRRVRPL